jgi:hypothetical protein
VPKRSRYVVSPDGADWIVTVEDGKMTSRHGMEREAIEAAVKLANAEKSQVLVQGQDGKTRTAWTHGTDPFPLPG